MPAHIRTLARAIELAMDQFGTPAMLAGQGGMFVQLGSMVIAAHPGDRQGKAPHYVAYEVGNTEWSALDDAQMLFTLQQEHLTPILNPHVWYGRLLAALDGALAALDAALAASVDAAP